MDFIKYTFNQFSILCVAFEPSTENVVACAACTPGSTGFAAYEEALWVAIKAYLKLGREFRPATITSTDSALADFFHGLIHETGTDVVCIGRDQAVAWPSTACAQAAPSEPRWFPKCWIDRSTSSRHGYRGSCS